MVSCYFFNDEKIIFCTFVLYYIIIENIWLILVRFEKILTLNMKKMKNFKPKLKVCIKDE